MSTEHGVYSRKIARFMRGSAYQRLQAEKKKRDEDEQARAANVAKRAKRAKKAEQVIERLFAPPKKTFEPPADSVQVWVNRGKRYRVHISFPFCGSIEFCESDLFLDASDNMALTRFADHYFSYGFLGERGGKIEFMYF